jgi:hypothetical protein
LQDLGKETRDKYKQKKKDEEFEASLQSWEQLGRPGAESEGAQQAVSELKERGYDFLAPWTSALLARLMVFTSVHVLIGGQSFGMRFKEVMAGKRAIHVCKAGINRIRCNIVVSAKGPVGLHACHTRCCALAGGDAVRTLWDAAMEGFQAVPSQNAPHNHTAQALLNRLNMPNTHIYFLQHMYTQWALLPLTALQVVSAWDVLSVVTGLNVIATTLGFVTNPGNWEDIAW